MSSPDNKKQQGDLGVAMAIAYYTKQKLVVSLPLTDNARYDLIIEREKRLLKVQCKSSGFLTKAGTYEVQLKTAGGNQSWNKVSKRISADETDLVFIYLLNGKMFELPVEIVADMSSITPENKYKEYEVSF